MERMLELAAYQEGYAAVEVFRDGDDLIFAEDFDDCGKSILSEQRIAVADFLAKGLGPWPWFDLGQRRDGALRVCAALGVAPPPWTEPLPPRTLDLFHRADRGGPSIAGLLDDGLDPDSLDPCGATPLWYAVWALQPEAAVLLIEAGADASRVIDLSARGTRTTTILDQIVEFERDAALTAALSKGFERPTPR
jgi:uncharacterized protein